MSPTNEPIGEVELTAFALGELDAETSARVAAAVGADAALAREVEAIRAMAQALQDELAAEVVPEAARAVTAEPPLVAPTIALSSSDRSPPRKRRWLYRTIAGASIAVAASSILVLSSVHRAADSALMVAPRANTVPGVAATSAPERKTTSVSGLEGGAGKIARGSVPLATVPMGEAEAQHGGILARGGARPMASYAGDLRGAAPDGTRGHDTTLAYRSRLATVAEANEPPNTEGYRDVGENPFVSVDVQPLSTFSIDVDTASYANVRRMLLMNQLPPPAAVRIEELINYFPYRLPPPTNGQPFAIHVDVTDAPWKSDHLLARVAIKAREIPRSQRPHANLVFLVDVSGSMSAANRLPLVKQSLGLLVEELAPDDTVALAVYAGAAGLVLPPTRAANRGAILSAVERLEAGGSTDGGSGIQLAYAVARRAFVKGASNRVILATDGDFNVGVTSRDALIDLVAREAKSGVFLTVLGYGIGNLQDDVLESIADKGNGNYGYVDRLEEAHKILVEDLGGTLHTVAKDVKIQLELNPARIGAYRLIGYENRWLAAKDFADDTKDAGEVGAGHAVTALYELIPAGAMRSGEDDLRYRQPRPLSAAAQSGELFTVKLRYKASDGDTSKLIEQPVRETGTFAGGSEDLRFAAAVAAFGMVLRDSPNRGDATLEKVLTWATAAQGPDPGGHRAELVVLVQRAIALRGGR